MIIEKSIAPETKLYWKVSKLLIDCIYSGVSNDKYDFQDTRSLILNVLCLISIVFLVLAYLLTGIVDGFLKNAWLFLLMPHLVYVLHLNGQKEFKPAKVLFLSFHILFIGAISLMIRNAGVEYNLMVSICLAPLLFVRMRTVLAYVLVSCIVFIGVRYVAAVFPVNHFYFVNQSLASGLSLAFAVLSTIILLTAFQKLSVHFSDSLISNNKYVEDKLSENKWNYHLLFENMIEGFAYCKMHSEKNKPSDFVFLNVNEAFQIQTGLENVVWKKISEVIPGVKESNPEFFEILGKVVLSENPERFEIYFPGIDKWFDISAYCPQPEHLVAVFVLISERKLAVENQKIFTSIVNSTEDAIISKLLDGTITSWNRGAENSFGYTAEEMIGKNISTLIPFHLRDEESKLLRKGEVIERHETQRIRKDGSLISVSITMSPIHDASGKIIGFSKISRDISQRLLAKAALKERASLNKSILANLRAQIAVMNHDGTIIEVNKIWEDFALDNGAANLDQVSNGINYFDVCRKAEESGDSIAAAVLKGMLSVANRERTFFDMEYPCFSPSEKKWFSMRVSTFESDNQKIVVAHEEITQRKEAENAIIELNAHLEQKIEERTKSLKCSKNKLQKKNQDITDSINYALRLQTAILPDPKILSENFSDTFIINLPQSIVSGDFYWFNKLRNKFMIACADSTGHGVPGALMSIVGAQLINRAIEQHWKFPSDILALVDEGLSKRLGGNGEENIADGMDMSICVIDPSTKTIEFAGAMSSIVLNSSDKAQTCRGSRFALGRYMQMKDKDFETQSIKYNSGDMLYLYSDGLKDQFGGKNNKKFMFDRQVDLFEKVHLLPAPQQEKIITSTFHDWKGELDQVDDVMVIGVRL